jgi:hypothetical protein
MVPLAGDQGQVGFADDGVDLLRPRAVCDPRRHADTLGGQRCLQTLARLHSVPAARAGADHGELVATQAVRPVTATKGGHQRVRKRCQ